MAIRKYIFVNASGDYEEQVTTDSTTDEAKFNTLTLVDGAAVNAPDAGGISMDGHIDANAGGGEGNRGINFDNPIDPQDVATKAYVDSTATGLDVKDSVQAATTSTAQIETDYTYTVGSEGGTEAEVWTTTTGTQGATFDGITLDATRDGQAVLIKDATDPRGNGIFIFNWDVGASTSSFTRRVDFDGVGIAGEVSGGAFTFVTEGNTLADTGWVVSSPEATATLGTDNIVWTQFSSAGVPTGGGTFVTRTGNVFEFTELDDEHVVIGNSTNNPVAVDTGSGLVTNSTGTPAHHIQGDEVNGLTIKAGAIEDEQVGTNAEINTSKIELVSHTPISTIDGSGSTQVAADDSLAVALNKIAGHLDVLNADLGTGGAAEVGYLTDACFATSPTTIQDAIEETRAVDWTTDGTGVTKGDLLFPSANDIVSTYATLTNDERGIGLACDTVGASAAVKTVDRGVLTGVLTAATPGDQYFWDGSDIVLTVPSGSGANVWRVGYAKNATDLVVDVERIKKNS